MKKAVFRYAAVFAVSVCAAMLLLLLAACMPQSLVDVHVQESAERMVQDGLYPTVFDKADTSRLDTWTDAIILAQCKAMSVESWQTVLTNPMYETAQQNPVESLYDYVQAEDPQPTSFYARYWMGFRAVYRVLLGFLNYYQILRYLAVAVLVLWMAVVCSVAHHTDWKKAFLFALSIIFVRPQIIVMSIQYSCCFLIAFGAMLAVPWVYRHRQYQGMFFFLIGIATMYFDFYTTPALTFGLPMVYLYLLTVKEEAAPQISLWQMVKWIACWVLGYLGMWFAKMVLTTLLTDVDGLANGLNSMMARLGMKKAEGQEGTYQLIEAVRAVWFALYSDKDGEVLLFLLGICGAAAFCVAALRRKITFCALWKHHGMLFLAMVPIVWMLAAPHVTYIHYWFQYRSIALTFWCLGLYCLLLFEHKPK